MRKLTFALSVLMALCLLNAKAQTSVPIPVGKTFYIQSAMNYGKNNGGYWDVPGYPKEIEKGSNIQVYDFDEGHDRTFTLHFRDADGDYEIKIGNTVNSRIDIQGGGKENGTSVKTWTRNQGNNQKFLFKHLGNGRFKIFDRNSGKAICLAGRKNANGTNVHIWDDHDGPWMEWYLIDTKTKKAFIPQTASKTPDFFIKNKHFKYTSGSMGGGSSEGKGSVEKIEDNKIFVKVEGTNRNLDVPPGEPTEKPFSHVLEITYENGKYIYIPDVFNPGELSDDGKKLSFSGDAYIDFTVARPPSELKGWIESTNNFSLDPYLKKVSYADIKADDENTIATEVSKLNANDQATLVVQMISSVANNNDLKVRKHVYSELSKATYKKQSGIIKMTLNAGLNNLIAKEPVQEAKVLLQDIQSKMINAK
jgi:hypothetical protein